MKSYDETMKARCAALGVRSVNPQPSEDMEVEADKEKGDESMETNDRIDQDDLNGDMRRETIKGYVYETMDSKTRVDGGAELEDMNEVDTLLKRLEVLSELMDEEPQLDIRTAFKNTIDELHKLDVLTEEQYKSLKTCTHQLFKDA